MDTHQYFAVGLGWKHLVNNAFMTVQAGILSHAPVSRLNLNGLMKVFQRERRRMKEPVFSFRKPFADKVVREVTIIADGHMTMARILPRIKMILHHVTIGAGHWIIAQ